MNKIYKVFLFSFSVFLVSCKDKEEVPTESIDFPAAYVVNGGSNTISIIDLNERKVKKLIQLTDLGRFPHHIELSPDGKKLSVALPEFDFTLSHDQLHNATNLKGGIAIIDADNGKSLLKMQLDRVNFNAVFTHDNTEIWTASTNHAGEMHVFDTATGVLKDEIFLGADPTEVVFSKDGRYAFVALGESSFILAVNVKLKKVEKYIKVDQFPTNVWLADDGYIYVENKNLLTINVVDPATMNATESIDLDFKPGQVAYHKGLNELWVCQAGQKKIAYFERKNNKWVLKSTIVTGDDAHAVKFSKDEKIAYVANQRGNTVSVINTATHEKIMDIPVGLNPNGIVLRE
ncbi:YncE family protein [Emticicia sp. 21SJ11W-3]|uniref:YncE family protein n=1 Tax=Emticicia sp. 21SJ11W-3 TaxID=2916755 RepID=UPI00209DEC19|nr:YncE family protein [Emticicia sp. 21SJ11W-3]UTA70016.1 YncE family protein [Emticicia sp. 21SJ11W-3]